VCNENAADRVVSELSIRTNCFCTIDNDFLYIRFDPHDVVFSVATSARIRLMSVFARAWLSCR